MDWQTIESAPIDGTEIIACFSNDYGDQSAPTVYGPWTVSFRRGRWMASWDDASVIESESYSGTRYMEAPITPTHWMHKPSPP